MAANATLTWSDRLIAAHTSVTSAVSHGERMKSDRYFVWQEDGANDFLADGSHAERAMTGRTDLYSKTELDPWGEALETAFENADIAWSRVLCDFEPETGFWHWSWDWQVL